MNLFIGIHGGLGYGFYTMRTLAPTPSADWCLFLDVDGTLIDFTDTPSNTRSDPELNSLLERLEASLGGSLALVSGRSIRTLDLLFAPLKLPAAGLHGIERRSAAGSLQDIEAGDSALDRVRPAVRAFVAAHPGSRLEDKGRTIAVHYRGAAHLEAPLRRFLQDVTSRLGAQYHVQEGNLVMEIKPSRYTKATAIEAFLSEPPFVDHTPVFVGDDITDQDGFRLVEARGGISIAVGDRVRGQWHMDNPAAVRGWLREVAAMHGRIR